MIADDWRSCPCDDRTQWCQALIETGYPGCATCGEHHRHPETCKQDSLANAD